MDEGNKTARAHSPLCQTNYVGKDEDSSCRDCSTDDNITKDLDHKVRNKNNDRTIVTNAEEKIERQSAKDNKGESVNSWYAADNIARGPLYSSPEMSDDDEEGTRKRNYKKESCFLWKIHEILEELTKEQKEHIVSWSPRGTSFKVHDPEAFVQEVMPRYSTATQFRSFEKMLNLYDFKKLKGGPHRGGYQHPLFRRDNRELCKKINMRPKPKRKKKESRVSVGGGKSHIEDDFFSGFDEDMSEKRVSMLGNLEDEDRHLSSIDDISMGYFQQMTTGVRTNLQNYNDTFLAQEAQAQAEVHTSNLYQNILNMRTSYHHLSSLIGVTPGPSGNTRLMEDHADAGTTSSSSVTTNQQQFAMFDHPIIPAMIPSSTTSATSTVVPFLNLSDSRHDHSAPTAAGAPLAGSFMQSATTMMGSVDFGVAGGIMLPSFPAGGTPLMSRGLSATGHAPITTSILPTRSRTVTSGSTPTPSASQINPTSLDPPPLFYSSLLDLGGRRGGTISAGTTNIFVDAATREQQEARRRPWSHSSAMAGTSSSRMLSPLSSSSFDHPTMRMAKDHRGQEEQEQGCDDHHSREVERGIKFEEPLSDDLEPTHLPPPS